MCPLLLIFETKQKAFHAKESPKLLDIEYFGGILLHIVSGGAGGSRTRTDITVQRILSPQRLPFRHRPTQRVSLGEEQVDKKS